ncbi:MAG: aldose 1-epimerase [Planctomycetaceae bacterium]
MIGRVVLCLALATVAIPASATEPVTLSSPRWRATFDPDRGGSLLALAIARGGEWIDLVPDGRRPENGMRPASWLMLPYSNRIRDGRFTFGGQTYQLSNAGNHAIHGDVRRRPWEVVERRDDRLVMRFDSASCADFNWPWPITATVEIRLDGDALVQSLTVANRGTTPMPAGFGWHPYYRKWLSRDGEPVELSFSATGVHPDADADGLPDGPVAPLPADLDFAMPRLLGDRRLDTCFAGFGGQATIAWPESGVRLRYECSPNVTHLVCFTPADRPVMAIEPVANANDGVNLLAAGGRDHGVLVVEPGATLEATFRTVVETR